jgi:hypothetical protein
MLRTHLVTILDTFRHSTLFFLGDTGNSYLFEKQRWCRKEPVAGLDDQHLTTGQKLSWMIHKSMILLFGFVPQGFIHNNI